MALKIKKKKEIKPPYIRPSRLPPIPSSENDPDLLPKPTKYNTMKLPKPPPPDDFPSKPGVRNTMIIPEIPPPPPPEFYEERERVNQYMTKINQLNIQNIELERQNRELQNRTLVEKVQEKPPEDTRTLVEKVTSTPESGKEVFSTGQYQFPYHYGAKVELSKGLWRTFIVDLPNYYNVKENVARHMIFQEILNAYESQSDEDFENEIYKFEYNKIKEMYLVAPGGLKEEWRGQRII